MIVYRSVIENAKLLDVMLLDFGRLTKKIMWDTIRYPAHPRTLGDLRLGSCCIRISLFLRLISRVWAICLKSKHQQLIVE